ncbi:hypothetical protein [Odoribacter sp. AF15-53]|uniref:hypothetical protein n=1 Tax=Odoribacter sp. AF15-53 TaxID=2292236 RepID=UPI000E51E14A|nr:hypothetical protein [Odoribacter sp. AF15-53]RHR75088.1 hypothetical protein DWW52_18580 [Odoribacter sp. AF15-53]
MKTFGRIGWVYMMTIVAALALASCGNSQKSKVQSGKQVQEPVGTVIQESEVIVEVDSITPDSTVTK